ncbi:A24 family peptidase [Lactobacillus sp. Sy-1]|uniref:prepilin peptidase n=1 Tax=Lactobacillus sp. Sy-1 TaxID=2109645 RepID=UPI001C568CE6|nr:A24 family peptidase [Lactobacillus sp. Sy-1]MBW1605314.1 prepilin peptidase [Lactobacillus sp. Sy-1]
MNSIILFVIGTALGSFISLVIQRANRSESIIFPRSHCDQCRTPLKPVDLIPIVSYLSLKGRCRYCKSVINRELITNEFIFGGAFILQSYFNFNWLIFISILILITLSIIDNQKLTVPTILIIILLIINVTHYLIFNGGNLILLIILLGAYLVVQSLNYFTIKIGCGDIDVLFIVGLIIGFSGILTLLMLATTTALIYAWLFAKQKRIAFIPFITIGYLFNLIFM